MLVLSAGHGRVARAIAGALVQVPLPKRLGLVKLAAASGFPAQFDLATPGLATPGDRARLLDGASELVLVPTFDPRVVEQQAALAAIAPACGVRAIHFVSTAGADARSPVTLLRWLGLIERAIVATGLPHTILHCTPYMQSIPLFLRRGAQGWRLVGPFRDAAFAWLDAADAGAALARRIASPRADASMVCQLSGPEAVPFERVAGLLAERLQEPVRYVDVCLPEAVGLLEANGIPPALVRALTEYWDFLVSGVVEAGCCDGGERLLGRAPRALADYLRGFATELRSAA
jgi:uncharacterized protein YbjT (DUF2867 family)